eukprot:4700-Heterococcus_DN1.PRE.1
MHKNKLARLAPHAIKQFKRSSGLQRSPCCIRQWSNAAACVHAAALSGRMMVQLADAVKQLEHWPRGVAVIVRGQSCPSSARHAMLMCASLLASVQHSSAFCAGADLNLAREHLTTSELPCTAVPTDSLTCYMLFMRTLQDGRQMCSLMTDTLNSEVPHRKAVRCTRATLAVECFRSHSSTAAAHTLFCYYCCCYCCYCCTTLLLYTIFRLRALPMVSVAVVNGAAVGGGAELTTACDYRVLSSDAKIQFVQVKANGRQCWLGRRSAAVQTDYCKRTCHENGQQARNRINNTLSKLLGLCVVLLRQLSHALKLLAWGYAVDAQQALAIGLADECQQVAAYRLGIHSVMTLQGPSWYHAAVITLAVAPEGVDAEETAV